jgi:hypothetical protein
MFHDDQWINEATVPIFHDTVELYIYRALQAPLIKNPAWRGPPEFFKDHPCQVSWKSMQNGFSSIILKEGIHNMLKLYI